MTVNEPEIINDRVLIFECKHTSSNKLPSLEDTKDGLLKMILFLEDVETDKRKYHPVAFLKLTSRNSFNEKIISNLQKHRLKLLRKEAAINNFRIEIV